MSFIKTGLLLICVFLTGNPIYLSAQEQVHSSEARRFLEWGKDAWDKEDWSQALSYFTKAHELSPKEADIYYYLGVAHEKTRHELPAMAWYMTYLASRSGEPQKMSYARDRYERLEIIVTSKVQSLYAGALRIARAIGHDAFFTLNAIAFSQARSGFLTEARQTRQTIESLGIDLIHSLWFREFGPIDGNYVGGLVSVGDIKAMRASRNSLRATADAEHRYTSLQEATILCEIVHFVHVSDPTYRIGLAKNASSNDPLEDIDVKVAGISKTSDRQEVASMLSKLAETAGAALLQIRAVFPREGDGVLSREAQQYVRDAKRSEDALLEDRRHRFEYETSYWNYIIKAWQKLL